MHLYILLYKGAYYLDATAKCKQKDAKTKILQDPYFTQMLANWKWESRLNAKFKSLGKFL